MVLLQAILNTPVLPFAKLPYFRSLVVDEMIQFYVKMCHMTEVYCTWIGLAIQHVYFYVEILLAEDEIHWVTKFTG